MDETKETQLHIKYLDLATEILSVNIKLNEVIKLSEELGIAKKDFFKIAELTAERLRWFVEKQYEYLESQKNKE